MGKPTVLFVLGEYLDRLKALEQQRAEGDRRDVPSHSELAALVGMDPVPFSRLVNNRTASIKRDTLGVIIQELRRRGFAVELADLLQYVEI